VSDESKPARIAAVVLNYRTPGLVLDCVDSLLPQLHPDDRVLVVDNASGDDSAERIARGLAERGSPAVGLLESDRNDGFSAGLNLGLRALEARAYLLLNSDTVLRPGALDALWEALRSDPRVGIASPRLEWPDATAQQSCFRFHTPLSELIAGSATGPIRSVLDRWDVPLPVAEAPLEPDWTSFAAVLVRSELLRDVGLLDEGFFMYYEDVDYCRRARRSGWRILHDPRARVVHLRGQSSPVKALTAAGKRRPRYYYASRARYYRKHFGWQGYLAANLLWTFGRGIAWLRAAVGRKVPHTVERELLDVWRS
jgi:N-acetylglucosaminyl-diphospho-decaprenol L-rhamnosyltransferase